MGRLTRINAVGPKIGLVWSLKPAWVCGLGLE